MQRKTLPIYSNRMASSKRCASYLYCCIVSRCSDWL